MKIDEFRFPWDNGIDEYRIAGDNSFDALKIAGQNDIDVFRIAGTISPQDALKIVNDVTALVEETKAHTKSVTKDYDKYFGEMEITNEEVEDRKKTANELEKVFLFLFALLLLLEEKKITPSEWILVYIVSEKYEKALFSLGFDIKVDIIRDYVEDIVPTIIETTLRNIRNPYFVSRSRAKDLAGQESNSVHNASEHAKAVKSGMKYKSWITMHDERVRHTHSEVDNVKIAINDTFVVGDCLMRYPRDVENGTAEEIANCRCVLQYSKN